MSLGRGLAYNTVMQIYLSHSSNFDYVGEFYLPIREKFADTNNIYFPHDEDNLGKNSKVAIASSDLILAEVSYPSTGQGIELGWAEMLGVPIIIIHKSDVQISSSLKYLNAREIMYGTTGDMIKSVVRLVGELEI